MSDQNELSNGSGSYTLYHSHPWHGDLILANVQIKAITKWQQNK